MTRNSDASTAHGRRSNSRPPVPADPRNPGDEFLQREIDRDRRREWILFPKMLLALVVVGVLVAIRQVFFQ